MYLTYYGISAFELESEDGTKILIDPAIEDNPHCDKSVEEFTDISTVLVTHGAFDHLGDAPEIAEQNNAKILCDPATNMVLLERGFPEELVEGHIFGIELEYDTWSVKILRSDHLSQFYPGKGGGYAEDPLIGPSLGYIVYMDDHAIYHMGDTSIFETIRLYGELYQPTVGLIPIGEVNEEFYPELYPDEAALVAEWLDSELVVPVHYPLGSSRPDDFQRECEERGVTSEINVMDPGETIEI